jgi:hypothetical protein
MSRAAHSIAEQAIKLRLGNNIRKNGASDHGD